MKEIKNPINTSYCYGKALPLYTKVLLEYAGKISVYQPSSLYIIIPIFSCFVNDLQSI